MKKINIAIDGYSSCGKSTIAKDLAKQLFYVFIDTGAMYRAISLFTLQNNLLLGDQIDVENLIKQLPNIKVEFKFNADKGVSETYLNGTCVEDKIRTMEVSSWVSKVAQIKEVRTKLVALQQELGKAKGVVMDGRDIGTVVFPDAELKLFITASVEERVRRRHAELKAKGDTVDQQAVKDNLLERDRLDVSRAESPLKQAQDAVVIDNTNLSKEEQQNMILALIQTRVNN